MKFVKKILRLILFSIIILILIEGLYRIIRAVQSMNVDILTYPVSVDKFEEYAYSVSFKPKKIKKNGVDYVIKRDLTLSKLTKYTEIGYKNKFDEVNIRVNRFTDYTPAKKNNEVRIVILGASSTYGDNVADNQTYSVLLEKKLNSFYKNLKITVINAGVRGKNIEERKEKFRFVFMDFSPDILIFYEGHNNVYLPNSLEAKEFISSKEPFFKLFKWPERFSLVYKDIFEALRYFLVNTEKIRFIEKMPCSKKEEVSELNNNFNLYVENFRDNVLELREITQKHGVELVLLNQLIWVDNFPLAKDKGFINLLNNKLENKPEDLTAQEGFYLLHEKFMDVLKDVSSKKEGIYWFDIYPYFNNAKQSEVLRDRVHLNVNGHKMLAGVLADFIIKYKLVEKVLEPKGIRIVDKTSPEVKLGADDIILAKTLRTMAKAFVIALPFEKFKEKQIKSISKKTEEDFNRRFKKFYEDIEGSGIELILEFSPGFSRQDALNRINSLTKKDLLLTLDTVPDYIIVNQVKRYFEKEKAKKKEDKNIIEWVKSVFNKAGQESIEK